MMILFLWYDVRLSSVTPEHQSHISVTQFSKREQTFLLLLRLFKPFPKTIKQQQQSITTTLYVSQFIFFLCSFGFIIFFFKHIFFYIYLFHCRSTRCRCGRREGKENPVASQMIANLLWNCDDKRLFPVFSPFRSRIIFESIFFMTLPRQSKILWNSSSGFSEKKSLEILLFFIKNSRHENVQFFRNFPFPATPQKRSTMEI